MAVFSIHLQKKEKRRVPNPASDQHLKHENNLHLIKDRKTSDGDEYQTLLILCYLLFVYNQSYTAKSQKKNNKIKQMC